MFWFLRLILLDLLSRLALSGDPTRDLKLENLALRQQLALLTFKTPRPRMTPIHRAFWILLKRLRSRWEHVCVLVSPATVVRWHRAGFRAFWRWRSRNAGKPGRPAVAPDLRALIRRKARENPT